jgi:hypothetical protein
VTQKEIEFEAKKELGENITVSFYDRTRGISEKRICENRYTSGATYIRKYVMALIWYRENEPDATGEDSFGLITALGLD